MNKYVELRMGRTIERSTSSVVCLALENRAFRERLGIWLISLDCRFGVVQLIDGWSVLEDTCGEQISFSVPMMCVVVIFCCQCTTTTM